MDFKAILPTACQAGVPSSVYSALVKHPQCTRLGRECKTPCEQTDEDGCYRVELDHLVPKSDGGTNALENLQWLCAIENRKKYTRPDPRYSGFLYFDSEINIEKLRPHQQRLAYGKAVGEYRKLFETPERLLARFMLLAWQVGAGKTLGMLSILFGINHARKHLGNGSARRIKRVLWLVHQRSLVESIAKEIREDLLKYQICDRAPAVREVSEKFHWDYLADVIVACPQALWDSGNSNLNDAERAKILSEFDAIVIDEAQFAIEQYIDICKLAPQALKFAVTATPMDADGTMFHSIDGGLYRDWFTLYSSFGYRDGLASGFYKELLPFDDGVSSAIYMAESGGDAVIQSGTGTQEGRESNETNNACRDNALIDKARRIAKGLSASCNYDHHVMVRAGGVNHAKVLTKAQSIHDDVIGVWSGSPRPLLGSDDNPWMLSKKNKGRIPRKGARIVICVNIGQFGINQPYCSIIVWLDPNHSMVELVQRIGRALRRKEGQDQQPVRLIWNSAHQGMPAMLKRAIDYILDMDGEMEGFVPLGLLSEEGPAEIIAPPSETAVKPEHRVQLASLVGSRLESGSSESDALAYAVNTMREQHKWSDDYESRVRGFGESLQTAEGRATALRIPAIFTPIQFVKEEKAVPSYGTAQLTDAITTGIVHAGIDAEIRWKIISAIENGDPIHTEIATTYLREIDNQSRKIGELTYLDPKLIIGRRLSKEEKDEVKALDYTPLSNRLINEYRSAAGPDFPKFMAAIYSSLSRALEMLFEFPVKEEVYHPFRHALADTLMREHVQRLILARTKYLLIKDYGDVLPGLHERFKNEVNNEANQ